MKFAPRLGSVGIAIVVAAAVRAQAPATDPTPAPLPPAVESAVAHDSGVAVTFDGETLYYVRDFMGILSPEERAQLAEKKIQELSDDPFYSAEQFSTDEYRGATRILYGTTALGLVTDDDASASNTTRDELASRRIHAVTEAIARRRARELPAERLTALIEVLISTAILVAALLGLKRLNRWLVARIEASKTSAFATLLESRLALTAERVVRLELRVLELLRIAVIVVAVLIYLQAVFSFVPPTRGYALAVLRYVLTPVGRLWRGFIRNVGNLFTIAVLVAITRYALKGMRWVLSEASAGRVTLPGISREWATPLYKIARLVLIAISAVMIYPYIPGSDTAAFKGLGLFAGAMFTLGASGTVGNFVGGLVAIFVGAFQIGDMIKIGDVTGVVVETTLVLTRVLTPKNEIVTVPNTAIISGQLINYSVKARQEGVILYTSVTIGYDAPWRTVHALLIEAAKRTAHLEKQPAPFVLQRSLDDFYVNYQVNAYTREPVLMANTYAELHQNIQDAFNEAGVEIMSPHYASLRDGNTVTIPEGQRPKGYDARRFELRVERPGDYPPTP